MGRMSEAQRRLLEQMMGPEAMGHVVVNLDWWNEKVCRNFLFGTCPHLIFGNTRMDLGPCPKTHSERILKQFQEHVAAQPNDPRITAFKQEHENTLFGFIEDCDRRIRASQRKLEKTPEENRKTMDLMKEIGEIELSIQGGTDEIEALGEAGKVEESMEKLQAVDALKNLKVDKEKELQMLNETAGASGHQKLRVCETCGAMLSMLDSDKRLADHFGGKLHLGYHELRQLLAKFAEERMTGRSSIAPPPPGQAPANAPAGPAGRPNPRPFAPSGPSGPRASRSEAQSSPVPQTPRNGPKVPPADEMPGVGHGDKVKREAGELVEDVKEVKSNRDGDASGMERDRYRERDRSDRSDRDRERDRERDSGRDRDRGRERDRDRYRDRDGDRDRNREDKYDKYDRDGRSSRHDDRDRRDRDRDRDRSYDDDRRRDRDRSRSPPKRRLV